MTFHKHPTRRSANDFRYARYTSTCRDWAVEKATYTGQATIPVAWRALRWVDDRWEIISRHRSRAAAVRACEKASRIMSSTKGA